MRQSPGRRLRPERNEGPLTAQTRKESDVQPRRSRTSKRERTRSGHQLNCTMKNKCFRKHLQTGLLVFALISLSGVIQGQTSIDLRSQAKNVDFSGMGVTRPFTVGTTLPPVCLVGQTFFKSDAPSGRNLYLCTATNVWGVIETGISLPDQVANSGKLLVTDGTSAQ